jgi:division protein 1
MTPSLIRGFRATVPSSELPKQRRRMLRGGLVDEDFSGAKIGLKRLGDRARGLLTIEEDGENGSENGLGVGRRQKKRKARRSEAKRLEEKLHLEDLVKQADEIAQDKENLNVRTVSQLARLVCSQEKLTQWSKL